MSATLATPAAAAPPAPTAPTATGILAVVDTATGLRTALEDARRARLRVGLVPTMGALHDGHRSLIARAARQCDVVVVSIFVNPTQFGDSADLAGYPRSLGADLEVVAGAGGHLVFAPPVEELYPDGTSDTLTRVTAPALSSRWEGASRPGHFDGVATVVTKLFAIAGRCRAYFGEKDFQQLAVVTRVVRDLSLPVEIVGCPTVREADGLARSSRNTRLDPDARRSARALSRALRAGSALIVGGEADPRAVEQAMATVVAGEPSVALDYAVVVRAADLEPAPSCATGEPLRLLVAATVGQVRLIDNVDPRTDG